MGPQMIPKLDRNEVAMLALKGGQGLSDEEIMPYLGVRSRQTVQRVRESLGEKIAKDFGTRFTSSESRVAGAYLIELCYGQFTLMDFV